MPAIYVRTWKHMKVSDLSVLLVYLIYFLLCMLVFASIRDFKCNLHFSREKQSIVIDQIYIARQTERKIQNKAKPKQPKRNCNMESMGWKWVDIGYQLAICFASCIVVVVVNSKMSLQGLPQGTSNQKYRIFSSTKKKHKTSSLFVFPSIPSSLKFNIECINFRSIHQNRAYLE